MSELDKTIWLIPVDAELSAKHCKPDEDRKLLDPQLLAARIRQGEVDRMAAFLYGQGIGESIEEAFTLLMDYLTLLDSGQRPTALTEAFENLQAKIDERRSS